MLKNEVNPPTKKKAKPGKQPSFIYCIKWPAMDSLKQHLSPEELALAAEYLHKNSLCRRKFKSISTVAQPANMR